MSEPALTMETSSDVSRYVRAETVASVVINAAVSAAFVWLIFRGMAVIPLWGSRGLAVDLIPTTFMITLMSTIASTLITRGRLRRSQAPQLARADAGSIARALPRNLLLRALTLALGATLVLVPLTVAGLILFGIESAAYGNVMLFKIGYGAVLALIVTPAIVRRALLDTRA